MLICAVSGLSAGCNSLLEIDPISEITNSNYWKEEADVKGYLTGIYNDYRGLASTTLYGEDRGDAMDVGVIGGPSYSWSHELTAEHGLNWIAFYEQIHHCNMLLKYAPGIGFYQEKNKKRILAQAYFLRAKTYLTLLQSWGDVPVVLEPTESYAQERPARSPAPEMMKQILSDADAAIDLFPETSVPDKNRASRPAALCLKAEALAWKYTVLKSGDTQDLTDAVAALEEVEKAGVELLDDYARVFANDNKKNNEIIFSLYAKKDEFNNIYASTLSVSASAGVLTDKVINKDDIPYTKGLGARHIYAPSQRLKELFGKNRNDKRAATAYIEAVTAEGDVLFTSQNKFRGKVYPDEERYFDDDVIVYRLADAKLLKAELLCYMGGAQVETAIGELLPTRTRAGIGPYAGARDQASVQREILDERGRELCFELKRWPDLMRAHAAGTVDLYGYVPNLEGKSTPLYLPILRSMIDLNTNLVQTEGY